MKKMNPLYKYLKNRMRNSYLYKEKCLLEDLQEHRGEKDRVNIDR